MGTAEIIAKPLPEVRLAAVTATVCDQRTMASVVGPAFDQIASILGGTMGALDTPIAAYALADDGTHVTVGYEYVGEPHAGFEIVTLPAVEEALTTVHHGSMSRIHLSWQALHEEIRTLGYEPYGPCREFYIRAESSDQSNWITELQQPVHRPA
ncbi:GyrI-like domain-containing protein [Nesterenkonia haasae]|uniref:GyrI-like domain-containing protein n=1 Tax=Nesterenkonia haasae TaxID=2587813 RepID=UPI0013915D29|nr:GyrI-like domain-containing protein [Nesterenkonia haasae]NDK31246.1 GyrI-like domain-containing protein [Nesterenkonia haasae]